MTKKLSRREFEALINDPDVPDEEIAKYLIRTSTRGGLNIEFELNPELVELAPADRAEGAMAMTFGNWFCRRRRRARFRRRVANGETLPVIVSEGDSWFQFPFAITDVIDHLENDYLVWSCGAAADTAENMIFDNPEYMKALDEQRNHVTAFLLSAAGNDVIGEDKGGVPVLKSLLHKNSDRLTTAWDLINKSAVERVLNKLEDAYLTVVRTVRADPDFQELPILIHGYDYARPFPDEAGDPRDPFWADKDAWLGKPMDEKKIHDPALRREIIEILIQELYDMLGRVADTDPHVHLVDLRGTLTKVGHWADEIHATSKDFKRVAAKFRGVLKNVVVPRPHSPNAEAALGPAHGEDTYTPIESPPLQIGTRKIDPVDSRLLGVGDMSKFATGFRRTANKIARIAIPEVAIEDDDSLPYSYLALGAKRGRAVCKIRASGVNFLGNTGRWSGTGFLVAPNILLTNYHVINSPGVAANAEAVFDYQESLSGGLSPTFSFQLNPGRLFISSPFEDLDYCFVWVEGAPQDRFGTIALWRGSSMAPSGESASIIHHPKGKPKRVSLRNNEVIDIGLGEVLVHYSTDTEKGSSGSPVLNQDWRLFALHHASTHDLNPSLRKLVEDAGYKTKVLNEGIKTSAIAIDIDNRADRGPDRVMAQEVKVHFGGTDSRTGYFGTLGRSVDGRDGFEAVVDTYRGGADDIDIAFWNVEWFNRDYRQKVDAVARIVADLNLDIWAFEETSPKATEALVNKLRHEFTLDFDFAASEPGASGGRQTTAVIWNKKTVRGTRLEWEPKIHKLLKLNSDDPEAARFEAVEGKIFNRYPALFRFEALNLPAGRSFDFNLIPVHLKAKGEGAKRRRMASNLLATAIEMAQAGGIGENDWIIGGDFNATLASGQFDGLRNAGFTPMSAEDERGGAITYLSRRYRSLIDSIFLSPGLARAVGADDFMIVAPDRNDPGFIDKVSDHRPVMIRLSIAEAPAGDDGRDTTERPADAGTDGGERELLSQFLRELREDPPGTLEELADLVRRR